MRILTPGGVIATVITLGAVGLIGCSSTTAGTPSPTGSTAASSGAENSSSAPSSSADSALASLNACDLLTSEEAAQFKPKAPGHLDTSGVSGASSDCEWLGRSVQDHSMTFSVLIRPTLGVKDIVTTGGSLTHASANGRPAGQFTTSAGGNCLIALGVTPTARVDVTALVSGTADTVEPCQVADTIASHVEPRLPKYTE